MSSTRLHLAKIVVATGLCLAATLPTRAADAMAPRGLRAYAVTPLVSDGDVAAPFTDASLKNPWGVAFNPNGFVRVANNGSANSTLYDGTGKPQSLVVVVPGLAGAPGKPTGIVFSGSATSW